MVRPIIEKAGYQLKKVEIKKKGGAKELIITIDKKGGLEVEDCAKVSRKIDPILEKANLIKTRYFLIISSPGIK